MSVGYRRGRDLSFNFEMALKFSLWSSEIHFRSCILEMVNLNRSDSAQ